MNASSVALKQIFAQAREASAFAREACLAPKSWAVCGAGKQGLKVAELLRAAGREVLFFVDAKATAGSRALDGTPCFIKEQAPSRSVPIIVAVHNPNHDAWEAKKQLMNEGFENVFLLQQAVEAFESLEHFWLAPARKTLDFQEQALGGLQRLHDDASRQAYLDILRFRLLGDSAPAVEKGQYFPKSIPQAPVPLRLVDCGAFEGDTLDWTAQSKIFPKWFAAFEPDPINYNKLAAKYAGLGLLLPCAVSSKMAMARFLPDGPSGALSNDERAIYVQMGALDEMLGGAEPNFIKMDIEGAELDALEGARRIIKTHQPRLAIACYHHPSHLWEVSRTCQAVGFQGRFMLRTHARNTFDVVTYGIEP